MANTELTYMYRDGGNWKQFETVVLRGEMTPADMDLIISKLESGYLFFPEQVGLPRLQHRWERLNADDHVYHELDRSDIKIVDAPPTTTLSARELVENFRRVEWDIQKSFLTLWTDS